MQAPARSHATAPTTSASPIAANRARLKRDESARLLYPVIASHPAVAPAATAIDDTAMYFTGNLNDASSGRWSRRNGYTGVYAPKAPTMLAPPAIVQKSVHRRGPPDASPNTANAR